MPKKGSNKVSKGDAKAPPPVAKSGNEAEPPPQPGASSWEDELTPEQRELEAKKKEERQKKAEKAAAEQKRQNEMREWRQAQAAKEARAETLQDQKWQREVKKSLERAKKEGILESVDGGDGCWYVELEKGTWKEVQGQFYCTLCNKHLNESTLQAHMDSEAHMKKVAWSSGNGDGDKAPCSQPAASDRSKSPGACPPCGKASSAQLEDWQEHTADGYFRCIPCNKVIDENHLATQSHIKNLEHWRQQQEVERNGYRTPELPYIAYVPCDENDPTSERWPKCLLCKKWVQDDFSHSGTHLDPQGSKEHQKNLRNYPPGDPWYEEQIREKLKWHPPRNGSSSSQQAPARPAPAAPPAAPNLPSGWEAARDKTGRMYYFNRQTGATQWEPPVAPAAPSAPAAPPAPPPPASASSGPLPWGWKEHKDPSTGKIYYHHQTTGTTQWERPGGQSAQMPYDPDDIDEV